MWLLLVPPALYALGIAAAAVHTARVRRRCPPAPSDEELPRLAVLVAARNEEARLPRCLDALLRQDYPAGRLDVLVADDHSTDGTAAVIERYRARPARAAAVPAGFEDEPDERGAPAGPTVRYVRVPEPQGHLQGKALAIHAAAEACDHEVLLVTDADCAPPPGWARALAGCLADPGVGVACGHTFVEQGVPGVRPWLAALQALDWQFLLAACSFLVETGRPVTAMGNNMALRRAAYDAVGGYPALPFSVTEDYVLFKTIVEETPWRARYPADPALRTYTLPLARLADVYQQRRRWARGGMRARPWVYAAYAVTHLAHLFPLVALAVAPAVGLAALGVKAGADAALLATSLRRSGRGGLLRVFPLWETYALFYMSTLPTVLLLFPRINWKDRKL